MSSSSRPQAPEGPVAEVGAAMSVFARHRMPELDGATGWLNSEPLDPAALRGKVVLVDFWTLTCINWLRTEPYIRAWSRAYRDDGLVVLGVHTPEFSFEHDLELVRRAVRGPRHRLPGRRRQRLRGLARLRQPLLAGAVLRRPRRRDPRPPLRRGPLRAVGARIQELLGVDRELVAVEGEGVEAEADWEQLGTPETYLGYLRGERFSSPGDAVADGRASYELPDHLRLNHWALAGEWTIEGERIVLGRAGGSIAFRFHARDAHMVLNNGTREPIPFRVLLDGEAPGAAHGVDVDADGSGVLREGRMYGLVRQPGEVRERTLEIASSRRAPRPTRSPSDSRHGRSDHATRPAQARVVRLRAGLAAHHPRDPGRQPVHGHACDGARVARARPLHPVLRRPGDRERGRGDHLEGHRDPGHVRGPAVATTARSRRATSRPRSRRSRTPTRWRAAARSTA